MLKRMFAIAIVALIASACSSSKEVVRSEVRGLKAEVRVDSVVVGTMETIRDTVVERTTVTIQTNEAGDTLYRGVVTDRERSRDWSRQDMATYTTEVRVDTVFVERCDSVSIRSPTGDRQSALQDTLKMLFWIVVGLIGLAVIIKIKN